MRIEYTIEIERLRMKENLQIWRNDWHITFLDRLLINFVLHAFFYLEAKKQRKKKSLTGE